MLVYDKMMMSKVEARKKMGEGSGNGKILSDIDAIRKGLYPEKSRLRSSTSTVSSRSKSVAKPQLPLPKAKKDEGNEDKLGKEKKSIWSWKALKALTHVRNKRFNCCFSLQVHSIEGLPPLFDDSNLIVHWKRRDGELRTCPAKVIEGLAEFEEQLCHACSVYGSRNGPHHSAKYEAKHFLLYASVSSAPELDLGKHRVDLTRILPLTLEELEEEKSSAKWTTSFRLSGKAKGATLNVSFGYSVIGNQSAGTAAGSDVSLGLNLRQYSTITARPVRESDQHDGRSAMRRAGSLPARSHMSSRSVEDIKDLHEVLPTSRSDFSDSVNLLCDKLDEDKFNTSVDYKAETDVFSEPLEPLKPNSVSPDDVKDNVEIESQCEVNEFFVTEHGIEFSSKEEIKEEDVASNMTHGPVLEKYHLPETHGTTEATLEENTEHHPLVKDVQSHRDELAVSAGNSKEDDFCNKESLMKELESALNSVSDLGKEGSDSQEEENQIADLETYSGVKSDYKDTRKGKSLSLDAVTDSVASDFLDMLGIEHSPFGFSSESEPESPRERLLRQFEKETMANGGSLFNLEIDELDFGYISENYHTSVQRESDKMPNLETEVARSKTKVSMLEDLETEALMREWGLNEKTFESSPPSSSAGFGSPIDFPPEKPLELPPLGEGIGPFVQTNNGGFLRSMSPALFSNAKTGGSLVMQVSSPVVVPAQMGSGIMEILQSLASVGIEKLSMQANKLMPLEDITGKTMQQIAWEAAPSLEAPERHVSRPEAEGRQNIFSGEVKVNGKSGPRSSEFESSSSAKEMDSEYVNLEDLAPLAMDKIEALSIEGLRIQSGMSEEDAPSNINPQAIGVNIGGSLGLEGAGGLQLLDIKDSGGDDDGLMGLSLTLDEWMRLDSGEIDDEEQISERTGKILAAHHASDSMRERSNGERKRGKRSRKSGLLGNNFTVALMVQLRDPLRNYEPVGTPMLSLIQVERVFVPPKPKIYSTVSLVRNINKDEEECEPAKKEIKEAAKEDEGIPQFKITEVHVAGLKTEPGKKKLWGSTNQQQSGSRWLAANGMGKSNKHPLLKSKVSAKSSSLAATTKVQPGETLWSISSRVHGTGAKWKELAALNPHIRNPNVILPNETIRLR
ncbi:hypothetical protein RJ639_006364 [Escallonia herrerae]|uniref:Protein PLASTID MOVEMENT IMPAIRED 1-RELATED 1-like n=1 Tax=Escallonia herrerae TaxID=1293975 RepID=A0AA88VYN0_9ASTE|nr:hypothetical protein RJ639_006364 [Escallonia herrerae]